jgi:hypothetical protein
MLPYPKKYDESRRPTNGRSRGGLSAVFMSVILKKNCLAQRNPDKAAERPHQGKTHQKRNLITDNISNPHEIVS